MPRIPHIRPLPACAALAAAGILAVLLWIAAPCPPPLDGVPFSTLVTDRDGRLLRMGLAADGRFRARVRLGELPPDAVRTVLRYEDRYFWQHPGVNPLALARSLVRMLTGGRRMGGSTLTMQVVRLRLGLKTGSLKDKLLQMLWALRLEWHHPKDAILEAYFNLAPYGGNVEGLGAAARIYFHKEPAALTSSEILSLVPVPQNPVQRTPSPDNSDFLEAAARLQTLDGRTGGVMPAGSARLRVHTPRELPFRAMHLTTELLAGTDGGLVRTAIDSRLQSLLERQIRLYTERCGSTGLANAAAMLVHWPSREVLALAGSADFFSAAIEGQIDGTSRRRSPGSALKPFIYALALDQGLIHPRTLLTDLPRSFAGYEPENFDGAFQGPLPADMALRLSRNVPAIALAGRLKAPGLYGFLRMAGVRFDHEEEHYGLSLVLGGAEVTMRELAALYAMLADGGTWKPLVFTLPHPSSARQAVRLLSPEAAYLACDMLASGAPDSHVRTRSGAILPLRLKTGTSNGMRDAWTCGLVGPYVLCVWLGNFDNTSSPMLVGARAALPLFRDISRALAARETLEDPLAVPPDGLRLSRIRVCSATGDVDISLCPGEERQSEIWFMPGVSPVQPTGILRRVLVSRETGRQSCTPGDGVPVIAEFWPTELRQLYARAGTLKPLPPEMDASCPRQPAPSDSGPRIVRPRAGMTYYISPGAKTCPIVLEAHAAADAQNVFWFSGSVLIGVTVPGEPLLHHALPGEYVLRAVDDTGRSSTLALHVRRAP
ncbi:MAG: penicillin-binding protein 1C [Desulfovibrionaceae bacterium]|nr:penicillin-binding protein 1C [Desulfovibrionaceae bacterium]